MKFLDRLQTVSNPTILELGTKRWGKESTHHKEWFKSYSKYIMADIESGKDVDQVMDAHCLPIDNNEIDIYIACSVYEHLHSPWIAAKEAIRVLKPGGMFFIQTHQTFPLHAYPHDYFRFSDKALQRLFRDAGHTETLLEFPCKIVPCDNVKDWDYDSKSFLNSCIFGTK